MKRYSAVFSGQIVAHHTDIKAMVYIIAKGSRNRMLQPMIMEVILKLFHLEKIV